MSSGNNQTAHSPLNMTDTMDDGVFGALFPPQDETSDGDLDRIRLVLLGLRDEGRFREALSGLVKASALWSEDPRFAREALLLATRFATPEPLGVGAFIDGLTPAVRHDPAVSLFSGLRAMHCGNLGAARADLQRVLERPDALWPFPVEQQLLIRGMLKHPGGDEVARRELLDAGLDRYILNAAAVGSLPQQINEVVNANVFGLPDPHGRFGDRAMHLLSGLGVEAKVACLAYFNAFKRYEEAGRVVADLMSNPASTTSPAFAEWAAYHARETRRPELEQRALDRFQPGEAPAAVDQTRAREITLRRQALLLDRPLKVFVGLFGQLRNHEDILGDLVATVQDGLSGHDLHFGLAGWKQSGGRRLTRDDISHFFLERVPEAARPIAQNVQAASGHELHLVLPNLTEAILAHSAASGQSIDAAQVQALLPPNSVVRLDDDSEVDAAISALTPLIGYAVPQADVNQFKMMSRIRRLRDALEVTEQRLGSPVDAIILLRPDLIIASGGLAESVGDALACGDRFLISDFDGHAELIEGAGDRYIVGSRAAITPLFEMYDHFLEAFWPGSLNSALTARIGAHQNVRSFAFCRGLTLSTRTALHYRIHRGALSIDQVVAALEQDRDVAGLHREAVQRFLDEHRRAD